MYFELQLSASVFGRVVRNRLRSLPLGVDLSVLDKDGALLVVDQVVIGDTTLIQREQAIDYVNNVPSKRDTATERVWTFSPTHLGDFVVPFLQVKQEVRVVLVSPVDLEANGPAPTAPAQTLTLYPVFNVSLQPKSPNVGVGGPLTLSYALAYLDFAVAGLVLTAAQRGMIAQIVSGISIAPSTVDLGSVTKLLDRPVGAINAGVACDPSETRVSLRADFDVYASPPAVDQAFFEAGPADLLAGKEWAMLMDADVLTQAAETKAKKALADQADLNIRSDPKASWDPAQTTVRVGSDITLLAACPSFVDDSNMDVALDLGLYFHVPADDHLVTHYQLDGTKNEAQVFGCALTGSVLYPFAGAALFADNKISFPDYMGGIAFGPYSLIQLVGVIDAQSLDKDISKSLGETCHKINDQEYECTSIVSLVVQLVPTLNSRFVLETARGVAEGLVLSGSVANLGELTIGDIEQVHISPFAWQVIGGCTGNGENNFQIANRAKIVVDFNPPAKIVLARLLDDPQNGYTLSLNDNELTVTPADPPVAYPCKIRLVTTRGVRTLTLDPARIRGRRQTRQLETALLRARASCYFWQKLYTKIETVHWLVDPQSRARPGETVQFWQILAQGARVGDALTIKTPNGQTVMNALPSAGGSIHASLLFAGEAAPGEITMALERADPGGARPLEVSIRQTLYARRATLPTNGEVRDIGIAGDLRRPELSIATALGAQRWDVRNASAPLLVEWSAAPQGETERLVVHDALNAGAAASETMLKALSVLGGAGSGRTVGRPYILGFSETVYLRTDEAAGVYDIGAPGAPRRIQTHASQAWFENTAIGRNLMARNDPERGVLHLYEVVGRRTV